MKHILIIALSAIFLLVFSCSGQQGKKVLYYYNPMDPKVHSDKPMKDNMGMDYVPVFEETANTAAQNTDTDKIIYWTCPMHPQIHADKAGKCPICGMDLIPVTDKKTSEVASGMDDHVVIELPAEKRQLIGVKTAVLKVTNLVKIIRTPGMISHDTELYNLQQEYISVYKNYSELKSGSGENDSLKGVIQSLEYKLMQMGFSREQIHALRYASQSDLSLILSGSRAWVNAQIYENDIGFIKSGLSVTVDFPSNPGKTYHGAIYSINTALDTETRSFKARILLSDFDGAVGHGAFANVQIEVPMGRKLALPEDAVIDTGLRQIVFVDKGGGVLEPRQVVLGGKIGDYYVVLSGVSEDETVITSANFLLDSDSQIKAVLKNTSK